MDKSEDLELEESSKLEGKQRERETFEKLLTELGGFGKYQKRLLCLLTPFLFMTSPLLQKHQVAKLRIVSSVTAFFFHRRLSCTVRSTNACQARSFPLIRR